MKAYQYCRWTSVPSHEYILLSEEDTADGAADGAADRTVNLHSNNNTNWSRKHKDVLDREFCFEPFHNRHVDRYIRPSTWSLSELVVQTTSAELSREGRVTWYRSPIRPCQSQRALRVSLWPSSFDQVLLKILAYTAVCFLVPSLLLVQDEPRVYDGGKYNEFKYTFRGFPRIASDPTEKQQGMLDASHERHADSRYTGDGPERALLPRFLMFLYPPLVEGGAPIVRKENTQDWLRRNPGQSAIPFLFISYTSHHFDIADEQQLFALEDMAIWATQQAGLSAFWSSYALIGGGEYDEDVYRINDIIRASSRVSVIVDAREDDPGVKRRMAEWSGRVWTFAEVLLGPARQNIDIWAPGSLEPIKSIPRNQFAALCWTDARESRKLIDHYEGNLILTRLQLQATALKCLYNRSLENGGYDGLFPGDRTYALAGLLHSRARVCKDDSDFQAFASLSLVNDSDRFLERLVCVLPRSSQQKWHDMSDAWGVQLWNIQPMCQAVEVCHGDSVLLGGAFAATVRWHSFGPIASLGTERQYLKYLVRIIGPALPPLFSASILFAKKNNANSASSSGGYLFNYGARYNALQIAVVALSVFCFMCLLGLPYLVKKAFSAGAYNTQAWLFGFEGHMDIISIEKLIWPEASGRLKWAPFGSPISSFKKSVDNECIGADPKIDPGLWQHIEHEKAKGKRLFTLVDTVTLTVTLFLADRPPAAFLACGTEGGLLRAVGVSYDWTTQTVYKETVLRMETTVLDRMQRVSRIRFGYSRHASLERACDSKNYLPV